ncbi:MAG: HAMP domain-containing histidine kinase [bacterium]|nr:HAMP domain-containing histidine kinase [bacterium]
MARDSAGDLALEGLVHDLNNVFDTISAAAELVEADEKWSRVARAILRSAKRGHRILNSYTATALAPQEFEGILDSSIEFARDLFEAMHAPPVEFVRGVEPGLRIRGSSAAWERVLLNLFVNAAQAMKQGGVVEIHARHADGAAEITISDNGPGIPPDILPRVFEPHFSTKTANSGLGLHIVQSIVEENGGSVSACNRERGATFHIRLPDG